MEHLSGTHLLAFIYIVEVCSRNHPRQRHTTVMLIVTTVLEFSTLVSATKNRNDPVCVQGGDIAGIMALYFANVNTALPVNIRTFLKDFLGTTVLACLAFSSAMKKTFL